MSSLQTACGSQHRDRRSVEVSLSGRSQAALKACAFRNAAASSSYVWAPIALRRSFPCHHDKFTSGDRLDRQLRFRADGVLVAHDCEDRRRHMPQRIGTLGRIGRNTAIAGGLRCQCLQIIVATSKTGGVGQPTFGEPSMKRAPGFVMLVRDPIPSSTRGRRAASCLPNLTRKSSHEPF